MKRLDGIIFERPKQLFISLFTEGSYSEIPSVIA